MQRLKLYLIFSLVTKEKVTEKNVVLCGRDYFVVVIFIVLWKQKSREINLVYRQYKA